MAATATTPALQVGLLATMPDGSLRFTGDDGQIQTIVTSGRFQILAEHAVINVEGRLHEKHEKLSQLHNRVVLIDTKRSDPQEKLKAQVIDHALGVLMETEVIRAVDVREHFGHGIGEDLEFEQALTYAFADIKLVITSG